MAVHQNTTCKNQNSMDNTDAGEIIDPVDDAGSDLQVNPSNSSGQFNNKTGR